MHVWNTRGEAFISFVVFVGECVTMCPRWKFLEAGQHFHYQVYHYLQAPIKKVLQSLCPTGLNLRDILSGQSGAVSNPCVYRSHETKDGRDYHSYFRRGVTFSLARRAMEPGHLTLSALTCPPSANALRLKSRHPFVPAAQQLFSSFDDNNIRAALWADHRWNAELLLDYPTRLCVFIPNSGTHPPGMIMPRTA